MTFLFRKLVFLIEAGQTKQPVADIIIRYELLEIKKFGIQQVAVRFIDFESCLLENKPINPITLLSRFQNPEEFMQQTEKEARKEAEKRIQKYSLCSKK